VWSTGSRGEPTPNEQREIIRRIGRRDFAQHAFDIFGHRGRVRVSRIGVALERSLEQRAQCGRSRAACLVERRKRPAGEQAQRLFGRVDLEERSAAEQLEQHAAAGEDICASVDGGAQYLLRREVTAFAEDQARACAHGPFGGCCDAEVGHLHIAAPRHQHVVRAHVAMHDRGRLPLLVDAPMRCAESTAHTCRDEQSSGERDGRVVAASRRDEAAEVHPVHELHGEVVLVLLPSEVEDLNDIGVTERTGDPRFVCEAGDELGVRIHLAQQSLERYLFAQARPDLHSRTVDAAHTAARELLEQRVAAETLFDCLRHR
jgi:hypothetical protein